MSILSRPSGIKEAGPQCQRRPGFLDSLIERSQRMELSKSEILVVPQVGDPSGSKVKQCLNLRPFAISCVTNERASSFAFLVV